MVEVFMGTVSVYFKRSIVCYINILIILKICTLFSQIVVAIEQNKVYGGKFLKIK